MSGKLDQSLDQIMKDTKPTGGRGGRAGRRPARNAAAKAKAVIAAPVGGVQKSTRTSKGPVAALSTRPVVPLTGESKIIVSNLPEDVTETQIKDYFGKTVGFVKKVLLTYGPNGRSRGVATITFGAPAAAASAAKQLDGVKVDNKAMKIEVVLGARQAPTPVAPKTLADRVSKPKSVIKEKTKPVNGAKTNGATTANAPAKTKTGRGGKTGRAGRPKKKTAEELDAEMMDYFGGEAGEVGGAVQPVAATNGGDTGMVDEVL